MMRKDEKKNQDEEEEEEEEELSEGKERGECPYFTLSVIPTTLYFPTITLSPCFPSSFLPSSSSQQRRGPHFIRSVCLVGCRKTYSLVASPSWVVLVDRQNEDTRTAKPRKL